ncbi:hypothetical protein RHGRI_028797 [Rhododendron griersonianum]|uniref:Uncharacterized protein n=1 Tax=Rhododendron griersonianum TaxID=479676 RepID=A0AAV6IKD7_9ERIC|nr:hypothetical protein RHGRI_028797 [Rhododendron griersonianum]
MIQNLALLAKWWRFYKDSDSLWVKVVKSKYKLEQSCCWVCSASLVDLFSWWLGIGFKNLEKYMWETTFHATI